MDFLVHLDLGDTGAEHIAEMILAQPFAVYELHLSDSRQVLLLVGIRAYNVHMLHT